MIRIFTLFFKTKILLCQSSIRRIFVEVRDQRKAIPTLKDDITFVIFELQRAVIFINLQISNLLLFCHIIKK